MVRHQMVRLWYSEHGFRSCKIHGFNPATDKYLTGPELLVGSVGGELHVVGRNLPKEIWADATTRGYDIIYH